MISETSGVFQPRDQIFQEYWPLPKLAGTNIQLDTFSVAGALGGLCIRVDPSPIITAQSDLLPLRIVPDDHFLAG